MKECYHFDIVDFDDVKKKKYVTVCFLLLGLLLGL